MYLVGFLFWGTPLSAIALSSAGAKQDAAVQAALAQNLTLSGTGTYSIPAAGTGQGTVLFGKGPIATIHFNASGFPVVDTNALIGGLVLALIAGVIIAIALDFVARVVPAFADRAKIAILFALAVTFYLDIGQPMFNHYGYRYFIYLFFADFLGFVAAALVITRWFLPKARITI
jgi:hypothetical protein